MSNGMTVFGLAAVMGLVGCIATEDASQGATTSTTMQAATTGWTTSELNVQLCDDGEQPLVDPFIAAWVNASLDQDPAAPSVTFGGMRAQASNLSAPRLAVPTDAVIRAVELGGFDPAAAKDPAFMTLKLASASTGDAAPQWLTCASPVPVDAHAFHVVATTATGSTAVNTMRPVRITAPGAGPTLPTVIGETFELMLAASDAAGLESLGGESIALRVDRLRVREPSGSGASNEIVVVGSNATTAPGAILTFAPETGTTSFIVSARLRGLRRVDGDSQQQVIATFAIDGNDSPAFRMLKNKHPDLMK